MTKKQVCENDKISLSTKQILISRTRKSEGLGTGLDGRMFVDETEHVVGGGLPENIADNIPHGMSPADL